MSKLRQIVCAILFLSLPFVVSAQAASADNVSACVSACAAYLVADASGNYMCGNCFGQDANLAACQGLSVEDQGAVREALRANAARLANSCPAEEVGGETESRLRNECLGPDGTPFAPTLPNGHGAPVDSYRGRCACPEGTIGVSGSTLARAVNERGGRRTRLRITYCAPLGGQADSAPSLPAEHATQSTPSTDETSAPPAPSVASTSTEVETLESLAPLPGETSEGYVSRQLRDRIRDLEGDVDSLTSRVGALERASRPVTATSAAGGASHPVASDRDYESLDFRIAGTEETIGAVSRRLDVLQLRGEPFGFRILFTPGVGFVTVAQGDSLPPLWAVLEIEPNFHFADEWKFILSFGGGYAAGNDTVPDASQVNLRLGFLWNAIQADAKIGVDFGFGAAALLRFQDLDYMRNALVGPYAELLVTGRVDDWLVEGGARFIFGAGFREDNGVSSTVVADGVAMLIFGFAYDRWSRQLPAESLRSRMSAPP